VIPEGDTGEATLVLLTGDPERDRTGLAALLRSVAVRTHVLESYDLWEIVGNAPRSALVVIDGDLHDASASSLCRLLRHHHPHLPVLVRGSSLSPADAALVIEAGGTPFRSGLGSDELQRVTVSLLEGRGTAGSAPCRSFTA
jgi:CheY-like chemotaxis protein